MYLKYIRFLSIIPHKAKKIKINKKNNNRGEDRVLEEKKIGHALIIVEVKKQIHIFFTFSYA